MVRLYVLSMAACAVALIGATAYGLTHSRECTKPNAWSLETLFAPCIGH